MSRRSAAGILATGVGAALLAGCGAAVHPAPDPAATSTPSSTAATAAQAPPSPRISARLRAREAALHRQVTAALAGHGDPHARYGALPRDLRGHQRLPPDQVLPASLAHPAEAIEGNAVALTLAGGSAHAVAVGPDVPSRNQGTAVLHTGASWVLTFSAVHGRVPLSAGRFTVTDGQGELLHPRVRPAGGGALPPAVPAGRPYTIVIRARVSVGDGRLRYAPSAGRLISEWDFDVETD